MIRILRTLIDICDTNVMQKKRVVRSKMEHNIRKKRNQEIPWACFLHGNWSVFFSITKQALVQPRFAVLAVSIQELRISTYSCEEWVREIARERERETDKDMR
jgi:hypothetical protein